MSPLGHSLGSCLDGPFWFELCPRWALFSSQALRPHRSWDYVVFVFFKHQNLCYGLNRVSPKFTG